MPMSWSTASSRSSLTTIFVVAILQRGLAPGIRQTKRDGIFRFRAAIAQALGEHLERRRLDEDEHGFGHAFAHLQGTLDIDLEDKR